MLFPDNYAHVKFYRISLGDVCRLEGDSFTFNPADWQPADEFGGPYEVS